MHWGPLATPSSDGTDRRFGFPTIVTLSHPRTSPRTAGVTTRSLAQIASYCLASGHRPTLSASRPVVRRRRRESRETFRGACGFNTCQDVPLRPRLIYEIAWSLAMKRLAGAVYFICLFGAADLRADAPTYNKDIAPHSLEELRRLPPRRGDRTVLSAHLQRRGQAGELPGGNNRKPAHAPLEARARFWLVSR